MQGWLKPGSHPSQRAANQGPRERRRNNQAFRANTGHLRSNASLPAGTGGLSTPRVSHYMNRYSGGWRRLALRGAPASPPYEGGEQHQIPPYAAARSILSTLLLPPPVGIAEQANGTEAD